MVSPVTHLFPGPIYEVIGRIISLPVVSLVYLGPHRNSPRCKTCARVISCDELIIVTYETIIFMTDVLTVEILLVLPGAAVLCDTILNQKKTALLPSL